MSAPPTPPFQSPSPILPRSMRSIPAESAIKSMQLAIDKAERDESFTVLRAPFDGIVGNLSVQKAIS